MKLKTSNSRRGPQSGGIMKLSELHLGMKVSHPQYGEGVVKAVNEYAAEVLFADGRKPVDPEASSLVPAEATASLSGGSMPLAELLRQTVDAVVDRLGLERPDMAVHELGKRWRGGKMVLQPGETTTQSKEVEIELLFFHKMVMMRNQLRVLEQKINSSETLTSAEKFDWQQYITR